MKKILLMMVMLASTLVMTISDADAKRMGGGGSIGRQSNNVSRQAPPANPGTANQARPAAAPAAAPAPAALPPKPASPWKGIVGGLIGGALIGAALSHFGLGGAVAGMLGSLLTFALIGLAIFFVIRLFRKNSASSGSTGYAQPAYAGMATSNTPEIGSRIEPQPAWQSAAPVAANAATWSVPADFDVPAFLRSAKTYFIRLQAAWDKADINDLREFTSAEMYAELKLEIQERGATANVTDVVHIDAELLGIETVGNDHLASVKFTGMIKESQNAPAEAFAEVWNLSKPANGQGGWVLAGIQQLS
ncbi:MULTISPECIES: Tim44-like domain-containing protein [unclassified Undibacterium]|uniref:Tim44 domain-containing protein n=1 Tax=unclassified Undibacterium TaxID=2630295 RepID=UPI002AC8CAAC|nr:MULTISPECIES: Tim44-like domain-containing protein [unclassified Undibacterium]MEB0141075.1 Tim44-like domain-containing protein [Undibacterium sp. CCC2.1]MEB0174075.1 Tim44-like domain-containing protein [Undibacterium sp. CCC1.1]MEB0178035.1 Tim44-like domain-containing protein [Undibacterium sp. CCC3.4]MEB0217246.1 Tim44-like domain-containing protein [Undibacterium sp. 5I2]WPX44306.1 Tim44-like domain-containing protein [Undibacterium sp. CCC3.4]